MNVAAPSSLQETHHYISPQHQPAAGLPSPQVTHRTPTLLHNRFTHHSPPPILLPPRTNPTMCFRPIPEPSRADLTEPPRHASYYTARAPRTGARVASLPAESVRRSHDGRRSEDRRSEGRRSEGRRSAEYDLVERRGHRRGAGATPRSSQRRVGFVERAPEVQRSFERVRVVTVGR